MAGPTLDTVLRHAEDVLYRDLDGEAVIVDLRTGTYFGLDPVGTRIWRALEGRVPLREVLRAVIEEYEVTEEAAGADLLRLADELLRRKLVEVEPPAAPA